MPKKKATLITYNTHREHFESVYERNKFYRGLFGYKQTVKKNGKTYEYEKDGLMDEIPNCRIDNSVFIVAKQNVDQLKEYFNTWENKVTFHVFTVMIEDEKILDQIKGKGDVPE
jgi:hypothetical protein